MEQIRLDNQLPVKKTDHTSKGDQLKWKIGNICRLCTQSACRFSVISH